MALLEHLQAVRLLLDVEAAPVVVLGRLRQDDHARLPLEAVAEQPAQAPQRRLGREGKRAGGVGELADVDGHVPGKSPGTRGLQTRVAYEKLASVCGPTHATTGWPS